jgi:roadblock/LC7 domain-containing protein
MMKLASLLEVEGVVAALSFLDDGTLLEVAGEIDPLHSDFAAEICYANGRITHQSSDVLATLSGMAGWAPRGWVMLGNELSVCAIANVVCFARSGVVSFNEVLSLLSELERQ